MGDRQDAADGDGLDDLELVARARNGDQQAISAIVQRYEFRLISYLAHMIGDNETARDLAQETFVAALRALPGWKPPREPSTDPLAPWLFRIATNRALSWLRQAPPAAPPPSAGGTMAFDERLATRELLRQALATLGEDDAACLVLHFVEGER